LDDLKKRWGQHSWPGQYCSLEPNAATGFLLRKRLLRHVRVRAKAAYHPCMHSPAAHHPRITHRSVLALAVPVMLSNVSTPLIGIVDTAVVGQIPDPAHIGAVAVAALVFTLDRKSTRLNSSHVKISYAVFCLKKKNRVYIPTARAHLTV